MFDKSSGQVPGVCANTADFGLRWIMGRENSNIQTINHYGIPAIPG
jgi:hypothetical protein